MEIVFGVNASASVGLLGNIAKFQFVKEKEILVEKENVSKTIDAFAINFITVILLILYFNDLLIVIYVLALLVSSSIVVGFRVL